MNAPQGSRDSLGSCISCKIVAVHPQDVCADSFPHQLLEVRKQQPESIDQVENLPNFSGSGGPRFYGVFVVPWESDLERL